MTEYAAYEESKGGIEGADWAAFRAQMPVARRYAYFDHAAVAPLPEAARQGVCDWADDLAAQGDADWPRWGNRVESVRGLGARLLGARPEEIALVKSTSEGIGLVAEGFPWQAGDNVVTFDCEFPANVYPWQNLADRGVETRLVPAPEGRIDLNRLEEACDARTRIVAVSWVQFAGGWRLDLDAAAELAHRRGALLLVDAIQGLGVFPIDVGRTPIDFLAADGHKWLLGPEGAGLFYVRSEHLKLLRPRSVGWNSVVRPYEFTQIDFTLKPTAGRYEGGAQNMPGMIGLAESLKLLERFTAGQKAARVLAITDLACRRLEEIGAVIHSSRIGDERSGIVSFSFPGQDALAQRRRLLEANIVLSCRGGRLRISPHAYANEEDVDRLMEGLRGA